MTLGEISTATDGSVWYGGALAACGRVGAICLGGRARFARDGGGGGGGLPVTFARARMDAGAAAVLPLSLGAFTFAPTIAVGISWMRSTINTDQIPVQQIQMGQMVVDDLALGLEAGVGAAWAVSAHWSLVGELGGLYANPVSSGGGGDARWDFMSQPPRGFVHVGLGLGYAR